jgi:hypothetical protein
VAELDYEPIVGRRLVPSKKTQAAGSERAGRREQPTASAGRARHRGTVGFRPLVAGSKLGYALGTICIDANCHLEHSRDTTPRWNSTAGELQLVKSVRSCAQS